jgi:hypothetical protein
MSECIIGKSLSSVGYARLFINGKTLLTARYLLSQRYNLDYDNQHWIVVHLCNNRGCVNIDDGHLIVGTDSINTYHAVASGRNYNANKAYCINGHELTPENTYVKADKRQCRACRRIAWKRCWEKKKIKT